jgi:glucosamine 6-phosphate synthetase-like amidotransferase/phosphosugar isomerase protein
MCGIVGYIGNKQAHPFLIEGLKRLNTVVMTARVLRF